MKFVKAAKVKKVMEIITDKKFEFYIETSDFYSRGNARIIGNRVFFSIKEFGYGNLEKDKVFVAIWREIREGGVYRLTIKQGLSWNESPTGCLTGSRWEKFKQAITEYFGVEMENIGIVALYEEAEKELDNMLSLDRELSFLS